MLFEKVVEDVSGKQAHDLAEVLGLGDFSDVAHDVVEPVFGDVCLNLGQQRMQ